MDPWMCQSSVTNSETVVITKFEDNFLDKLPDSAEYLAILEEKLRRIKNDPNILRQLAARREACMQQLLNCEVSCEQDTLSLEEPVSSSQILRTILPQNQALSKGEIVDLVKYDQLNNENSESDEASSQAEENRNP